MHHSARHGKVLAAKLPRGLLKQRPSKQRIGREEHGTLATALNQLDGSGMTMLRRRVASDAFHHFQGYHFPGDLDEALDATVYRDEPVVVQFDDVAGVVPTDTGLRLGRLQRFGPAVKV